MQAAAFWARRISKIFWKVSLFDFLIFQILFEFLTYDCCCCCCCRLNNKRGKQNHCTSHRRCDLPSRLRPLSITNTATLVSAIVVVVFGMLVVVVGGLPDRRCPPSRFLPSPSHDRNNFFLYFPPWCWVNIMGGKRGKNKEKAVFVKKDLH